MRPVKSALWLALVASLAAPMAAKAQQDHAHEHSDVPPVAESKSTARGHADQGAAHAVPDEAGHDSAHHLHHGAHALTHESGDPGNIHDQPDMAHPQEGRRPSHGPRDPIPALTDADRAAAFPTLKPHHQHGSSRHSFWLLDQFETSDTNAGTDLSWEASAWMGSDLHRLWLRTEGHALDGTVESGRLEVLYGRPVRPWWDLVAGIRQDFGAGPSRTWAAFGVQGTAPYLFEVEATGYIGESGRTALNVEAEYEMLLTNRLILTWKAEATAFGKSDPEQLVGSGLSTVEGGLRMRYEIRRQFAPYIGFEREWSHGRTADLRAMAGQPRNDSKWVVGLRIWF